MPALLAFLNTTKYPASLHFLLMTLGPHDRADSAARARARRLARWLTVFGRVPFFFYLLHIPLIHALALVVSQIRLGEVSPWLFANHPMGNPPAPDGYTWSLPLLYAVWARGDRAALLRLPLVRGPQGPEERLVAELPLMQLGGRLAGRFLTVCTSVHTRPGGHDEPIPHHGSSGACRACSRCWGRSGKGGDRAGTR